jgi:Rab GDP dissociation inhibitor
MPRPFAHSPVCSLALKIKLYYESMMRYEGLTSPYIYPLYGLGELPQAFARLSAVHGGTYMLDRPELEVEYDESGVYKGVRCGEEFVKSKFVVGDPTYFRERVIKTGKVVRAMCILTHPIPGTNDASSLQMILPQKQVGRKSDIYVFCCSATHNVAPKNTWLAFVSTTVESTCPEDELLPGLSLLGPIQEKFVEVVDVFEPLDDGKSDKVFISKGYDATSHFETEINDVLDIYERITGKPLDLNSSDMAKRQEA